MSKLNKTIPRLSVSIAAVVLIAIISLPFARGSHHFETALIQGSPAFDLTDVYVFPSERSGYTAFVVDFNPSVTSEKDNPFASDGLYSLHISSKKDLSEGMTLTFRVAGDTIAVGKVNGANEGVGSIGEKIGTFNLGIGTELNNGIKVWAGPISDPFMGNCVGLQRQHIAEATGVHNPDAYDNKADFFYGKGVGSIVIELPNILLGPEVFLFATIAKRLQDSWVQMNRMANPLLTHVFMSADIANTIEHVQHRPDSDVMRRSAIQGATLRMVSLAGTQPKGAVAYVDTVASRLLPDLIGFTVGKPAHYAAGSMGGRKLADDVMDSQLTLFWGNEMTDGANNNSDRRQDRFPYVLPLSAQPDGKPIGYAKTQASCKP